MTAAEQLIERVKTLTEEQARHLLRLLPEIEHAAAAKPAPAGPIAMLGFARKFYAEPRTTAQWLRELREGEE